MNFFNFKNDAISAVSSILLIFCCCFNVTAQAHQMPDWSGAVLDWVEAGLDTHYYTSSSSATLSWGETYILQTYNLMYQTDSDTLWLSKIARHGLTMIKNAKDVPVDLNFDQAYADGFLGWGASNYSATGEYEEWLVHDGHFCTELAKFIRTVYQHEELHPAFLTRADTLLNFLEKNVVAKWYSVWNVERPSGNGTYHNFVGRPNMLGIPINHFAAFGNFLLQLAQIAECSCYHPNNVVFAAWYRETATDLARLWKQHLRYNVEIDGYQWGYWYDGVSNDLSHAAIELGFAIDCYDDGVVFDSNDMDRFAHTLTHLLWKNKDDIDNAEMWDFFQQQDHETYVYDQWARTWPLLGWFDPLAWRVMCGVMRRYVEAPPMGSTVAAAAAGLAFVRRRGPLLVASAGPAIEDIDTGDGDRYPDAGETWYLQVPLVNLTYESLANVSVELSCDDPSIQVVNSQASYLDLTPLDTVYAENRLTLKIDQDLTSGRDAWIQLKYATEENYRLDSTKIQFGPEPILLVDDDGGVGLEFYYRNNVLDSLTRYQCWDINKLSTPAMAIHDFDTVIWFTGDQQDSTLTQLERQELRRYLDSGGKLLLFSSGVESDLLDSSQPDSGFFIDYLHAYPSDEISTMRYTSVWTVDQSFFPFYMWILWNHANSTYRGLVPAEDAKALFNYSSSTAGLYTNSHHHLVYLTFGLENALIGPDSPKNVKRRRDLLSKLMKLMDIESGRIISKSPLVPETFRLQVFPNPFNSKTVIRVASGQPQNVKVAVFNVRGQWVKDIWPEQISDGFWQGEWNGKDANGQQLSTGVYFIQAQDQIAVKVNKVFYTTKFSF